MSVDPWHEVKHEVQNSLDTAENLRASFLRIQSTASANSEELNWARNELKGTLAALDADLEDLEESVRIVEEAGGRLFGVEEEEVMARRKYVVYVRKQIESMRKEVNSTTPTARSGPARSPTTDSAPREDDQAEWARLEQEMEVQRQDTTLDTISGTLHTLAEQAGLIGQEVGEHNELLTDLESQVDRSDSKLNSAMKKMKHFIRETEETKSGWCIGQLRTACSCFQRPIVFHRSLSSWLPDDVLSGGSDAEITRSTSPPQKALLFPSSTSNLTPTISFPIESLIEENKAASINVLSRGRFCDPSNQTAIMDRIRAALIGGATPNFMGLTIISAYLALSLRPTFIPLVFLLSTLIVYVRATVGRPEFLPRFFTLLSVLCVATVAAFSSSTNSAMSTKYLSAGLLLAVAVVFSLVALAPIWFYANARKYVGSRSALGGILLFPTLWTTTWSIFVWLSPLGRLGSWTPMSGVEMYSWVLPVFGQAGIDYITALWAVVVAEYAGQWAMGSQALEDLPNEANPNVDPLSSIIDEVEPTRSGGSNTRPAAASQWHNPTPYLLVLLFIAIIPSYDAPILPLPAHSPNTTELTVGCVHPFVKTPGTPPTLEDYIHETKVQAPRAKVLLWPEGAAYFRSAKEKAEVFELIANVSAKQHVWVGVAYERSFTDGDEHSRGKRVRGHNGLAIFGPGVEPVTYVKRRLVPLVESFSYETTLTPPPKYLIPLPRPNYRPKTDKTWPRMIPVTAAICLDVSAPLAAAVPVNHTDEESGRPALILAPARTWHPDIGKAMFQHASMRAVEQGSSILWCDGGDEGISGVGGLAASGLGPVGGVGQIGTGGSWLQNIAIPFPYEPKAFAPTWYSRWGDLSIVFLAWITLVAGFAVPGGGLANIIATVRSRLRGRSENVQPNRNESTPLLIDA